MRKLSFAHSKELEFDTPIIEHSFCLRMIPSNDSRQTICALQTQIIPAEHITNVTDEWGKSMCIGDCSSAHTSFAYSVSGIAWVNPTPYTDGTLHPVYRYSSELTAVGTAMEQLYRSTEILGTTPEQRAREWMHTVYTYMTYEKGVTDVHTTAEQAAQLHRGVCQDFAHIMIALCRRDGIPARYMVGYMVGEGETHAWVSIFNGEKWYGLDPTNDCEINDGYISLTYGRDYTDCILDKGFFRTPEYQSCAVTQKQRVSVTVYDA